MRKALAIGLGLTLLFAQSLLAQQNSGPANNEQGTTSGATAGHAPPSHGPVRSYRQARQSAARRRSYEREVGRRRHSRVSKKEVVFLAAIAGTPMGIGAVAAGGTGLAIGAIVGGWGAFVGYKLWHRIM